MLFPSLMPKALEQYLSESTFEAVFERLIKNPSHLLTFFETAAADETWCDRHPNDMHKLVDWLNTNFLHQALPQAFSARTAKAIREHYSVLESHLPLDVKISMLDGESEINSILLAANSSYFREIIYREFNDQLPVKLSLKNIDQAMFQPFISWVNRGEIPGILTASEEEIIRILRLAQEWKFEEIVEEAQKNLRKYVLKEQALTYLLQALNERWLIVAQVAIEKINENESGFTLFLNDDSTIGIAIETTSEHAENIVGLLKNWITTLRCGNGTLEDMSMATLAKKILYLAQVDLSQTKTTPVFLDRLPNNIQNFTFSECPWLSREELQRIFASYPQIEQISLANNSHLASTFWSVFIHCKNVKKVSISGCYQIEDNDFIILLKSCQFLEELNVNRCSKITDRGFSELAKRGQRLVKLSISRTKITDSALAEISVLCPGLVYLDLSDCHEVSDRGVLELLKNSKELQSIHLERTVVDVSILERFKDLMVKRREK